MTVPSATSEVEYAGDGSDVSFPITFAFLSNSHIVVTLIVDATEVETVKTITTHYTLTGAGGTSGTLTMLTAPAVGETLRIERVVPLTQTVNLRASGSFSPSVHENALDRAVMGIQQVSRELTEVVADLSDFSTDLDTAEADIATHETRLDTAESEINTAQADIDAVEAVNVTQTADIAAHETRIDTLEALTDTAPFLALLAEVAGDESTILAELSNAAMRDEVNAFAEASTFEDVSTFEEPATFEKGVVVTQSTEDGSAVTGTGNGTGAGGTFVGGDESGPGTSSTGGAPNGPGATGTGTGTGAGGSYVGGATGSGVMASAGGSPTADTTSRYAFEAVNAHIKLSGGNPVAATAVENLVTPLGLVKAYARIRITSGVLSLIDGFNVDITTPAAFAATSGGLLRIGYAQDFTTNPVLALSASSKSGSGFYNVSEEDLGNPQADCRVRVRDNSGANVDLTDAGLSMTIYITAFGRQ